MHPHEGPEFRIAILERKCLKLGVATAMLSFGWLVTFLYVIGYPGRHVRAEETLDVLKVHTLVVLDDKGAERVRIGVPSLTPNDQRQPAWKVPVSGITLYDPDGKTRGGFVTTNSRPSEACLLVEAENHQPILFANPNDRVVCR